MNDNEYWAKALRLEEQDRVDDAITVLRTEMGVNAGHWQAQVSYLFETRAKRLWKSGQHDRAREAAKSAIEFAWDYAGHATSGSEGLMLSEQAHQVERRMRRYLQENPNGPVLSRIVWGVLQWPIAFLWAGLAWFIRITSRVTSDVAESDAAAVYVNWHRYQSFLISHHGGRHRWMLCSPAPQLEPVARYCRLMGLRLVRGASGERAKEALEELRRLLMRGESVVLAVDGPRGPIFQAKRGCVDLAKAAGVPIVPVAYRCSRGHEFRWRWDRTLMPLPFSRIEIVHGTPITPTGTDDEMLLRVNSALNAME